MINQKIKELKKVREARINKNLEYGTFDVAIEELENLKEGIINEIDALYSEGDSNLDREINNLLNKLKQKIIGKCQNK